MLLVEAGADVKSDPGQKSLGISIRMLIEKGDVNPIDRLLSYKSLGKTLINSKIIMVNNYVTMLDFAAWY